MKRWHQPPNTGSRGVCVYATWRGGTGSLSAPPQVGPSSNKQSGFVFLCSARHGGQTWAQSWKRRGHFWDPHQPRILPGSVTSLVSLLAPSPDATHACWQDALCVSPDCDFEQPHLCGYKNQWNANVNWYVGGGKIQLLHNNMPYDHTYHNKTGEGRSCTGVPESILNSFFAPPHSNPLRGDEQHLHHEIWSLKSYFLSRLTFDLSRKLSSLCLTTCASLTTPLCFLKTFPSR